MEKILILLAQKTKRRDLNFYRKIEKYLKERGKNLAMIGWLGGTRLKEKNEKYFSNAEELIFFLKKEKIKILASNAPLKPRLFKKLRSSVAVMGALNFPAGASYDFRVDAGNHDESAVIEFAQQLSIVDKLNWDSNFFGINIARLNPTLINENILKLARVFCRRQAIKCLYFRSDSYSYKNVELAEKNKFHFASIRVTYVLEGENKPKGAGREYTFRWSKKNDISWLVAVSRNAYADSRYYFDRSFSRKICDKFYIEWIKKIARNSSNGEKIFILERNKRPIAYIGAVTVGREKVIELIAVDLAWRGQGMGKKILSEFILHCRKEGFSRIRVVTQGRNIAAQRLYQSCGFQITNMQIDYHKWF